MNRVGGREGRMNKYSSFYPFRRHTFSFFFFCRALLRRRRRRRLFEQSKAKRNENVGSWKVSWVVHAAPPALSSLCNACHHHLLLIILLLFLLLKHLHFHFILYHLSTPPFFSHFVLLFSVSPLRRTPSRGGSRNHSLPHQLLKSRRTSGILRSREWHKSAGRGKLVYYCLLLFVPLRRADETLKHARIRTNAYDCAAPLIHDYFSLLFFFFLFLLEGEQREIVVAVHGAQCCAGLFR